MTLAVVETLAIWARNQVVILVVQDGVETVDFFDTR